MTLQFQLAPPPPPPPPKPSRSPNNLSAKIAALRSLPPPSASVSLSGQKLRPLSVLSADSRHRSREDLPPLSPAILSFTESNSGLRFREKLLFLERDLGLDASRALTLNPDLRSASLADLRSLVGFLLSFGLESSDAGRVLSMYPQLLTADPKSSLLPVFEFLLGAAGIPFDDVRKAVVRCPRLLVSSVHEQLRPALYFLRRLGFVGSHRITCQTTLLLVSSVEGTLVPKLEYIQSLGFSYRETARMLHRSPALLTFSIENNYRPKVEFLVEGMGREISQLKEFPQYFSFNLEGRIKPRHRMLVESGFSLPLSEMLRVSDGEFRDRLVEMRLNYVDGML